jgi:hypothetical protein
MATCAGVAQASHIQTTTLGATGAAGIRTDGATPMEQGHWNFGMTVEHSSFDQLSQQELLDARAVQPEASLHSLDSILAVGLDVGYGLSPDITVGVHVPYLMRKDIVEAGQGPDPEIEHLGDSDGFGDPTLYGLWRFYEDKPSDVNMGLIAGLKLPVGKDDNVADTGETFETEFQPSSGSWDPFAGLAWSRSIGKFNLAASTIYTFAMSGTANTNLGDLWTYNFATGYGLGGAADMHWNAALELNGGWHDREHISGEGTDPNSGGSWLYLSPGVTVTGHKWSAYASWAYPIDKSINGTQDDLGSRILVGFSYHP